ncbi:MAG: hypothetical protein IKT59_03570 [Bacteroidales bacterium]|nr:hypothetical protein [Bacteroidales bacterium]
MSGQLALKAQSDEVRVGLRGGYNAAFGGFAAVSIETKQTIWKDFSIDGGVQCSTIGRTALEARPEYTMDFTWGKISPEILISYTNLASVNSFAAGAGASADFGGLTARFGWYYRIFGGHESWITENFNIYYDLRVHLLRKVDDWRLNLIITNNEIFELERHFQPTFIAECFHYPKSRIGISFGIGCKPAGMFNMSADNYQTFIKTGLCYRW